MAVSDTALANHEELFPGHVSTLARTDPELIEVFDNFAFDQVLAHGGLETRTRLMIQLASLIACQAVAEYRVMLEAALTAGVTPVQAKEVLYQAVPYVGMGRVFDFLHATNDVLSGRGVPLPLPGQSTTTAASRASQGRDVQERIVGAGVAANLSVGNDRATLIAAATHLLPFIGYPRTLNALRVIDEAAPAPSNTAT